MALMVTPPQGQPEDRARDLPYGEFAIALAAADLPNQALTDSQVFELAGQGLERLGAHRVRETHRALVELNGRALTGEISERQYRAGLKRLGQDVKRLDRCLSYDCFLRAHGPA